MAESLSKNYANSFVEPFLLSREVRDRSTATSCHESMAILQTVDKALTKRPGGSGMLAPRSRFPGSSSQKRACPYFLGTGKSDRSLHALYWGNEGKWALVPQGVRVPVLLLEQPPERAGARLVTVPRASGDSIPAQLLQSVVPNRTAISAFAQLRAAPRGGSDYAIVLQGPRQRHEMSFLRICQ